MGMNYRDQWKSIGTPYKTFNVSGDAPITRVDKGTGYLSAGINVFNDKAGESEMSQLQSNLSIAYHVNLSDNNTIGAGISAGYAQRTVNYANLKWGSQYDGYSYNSSLPSGESQGVDKKGFMDIGTGIVWSYSKGERYMTGNDQLKSNIGFSVFHVNRPDCSFNGSTSPLDMRTVFFGDFLFGIPNSNLSVLPRISYVRQGVLSELTAGASFRYVLEQQSNYTGFQKGKAVAAGLCWRAKDAMIATFNIEVSINTSSLTSASSGRGGMEAYLGYSFDRGGRRSR
jgi:type IX secretion system PorP/SprF family membrane protein